MNSYLDSFLNFLEFEKRYSQHTLLAYKKDLQVFSEFIGEEDLASCKHSDIRSWIIAIREEGNSEGTVNRKISVLRSFYKFLLVNNVIEKNPVSKISNLKSRKRLPSFVKKGELEALLTIDDGDPFEEVRDKIILAIIYGTGIRLSELININESDFKDGFSVLKVKGKGNKERLIPVPGLLRKDLLIYQNKKQVFLGESSKKSYFLITNKAEQLYPAFVYRVVKSYLSNIEGVDKRSPHVLRHTFATHLLENGAELNAIKELLGHANLQATQVYTHNSLEKIKEAFKNAHPKA